MPRNITTAVINQLESSIVRPAFLVALMYPTPVYMWSGVGNLSWGGATWIGSGNLGTVSTVTESTTVEAQGMTLTLSGIPNDLFTDGMDELNSGCIAKIYLGFFDASGNLVPDPIPVYIGLVDQPSIELGTENTAITLSVENRLTHLNRARGGRYTDQDQRSKYPNDGSLRWVSCNQDIHLEWN